MSVPIDDFEDAADVLIHVMLCALPADAHAVIAANPMAELELRHRRNPLRTELVLVKPDGELVPLERDIQH